MIECEGIRWMESEDPTFEAGVSKTAIAPMTNPTSAVFAYTAQLYLDVTKVASSGVVSFSLNPSETKQIRFPISFPVLEGTWHVYLDVFVGGELIATFQATEDVTLEISPAIDVGPIIWE